MNELYSKITSNYLLVYSPILYSHVMGRRLSIFNSLGFNGSKLESIIRADIYRPLE